MKGSELAKGDPGRKWEGRVVLQGKNVKDQDANAAAFQDMTASASLTVAGRFIDATALLDGHFGSQSDAPMAYTQTELAELGGDET